MLGGPNLTTSPRYKFVESIVHFVIDLWHQSWKSPGELCSENREIVWIFILLLSKGVFGLKELDKFRLVEG